MPAAWSGAPGRGTRLPRRCGPPTAQSDGRQPPEHVDRFVLSPPGADVDDRRVEQDRRRHPRPPSAADRGARTRRAPRARRRRASPAIFISTRIAGSEASVAVRKAGSIAARTPQIMAMTGPKRQVLVIGVPSPLTAMPWVHSDELVQVAGRPVGWQQERAGWRSPPAGPPRPRDDARGVDSAVRAGAGAAIGSDAAGDPVALGRAVDPAELGRSPGRRRGRRWPSRGCRRTAARSGSRTG